MADHEVAFAPKAGFSDPDAHGAVFISDSQEVNLRESFANGKGYLITDDPKVIEVLDRLEWLKRASVDDAKEAVAKKSPAKQPSKDGANS